MWFRRRGTTRTQKQTIHSRTLLLMEEMMWDPGENVLRMYFISGRFPSMGMAEVRDGTRASIPGATTAFQKPYGDPMRGDGDGMAGPERFKSWLGWNGVWELAIAHPRSGVACRPAHSRHGGSVGQCQWGAGSLVVGQFTKYRAKKVNHTHFPRCFKHSQRLQALIVQESAQRQIKKTAGKDVKA